MGLGDLVQKLMMWVTALVMGIRVAYVILKDVFKLGYGAVFSSTTRAKPACLSDPTLGTHSFLHLEDVRLHYVISGPEDKPLMLFLHGFPEFWYSWRHQIREFQKDYRVVAIDQRGYAESDKPSGIHNYVSVKLMSDIKQVILALGYKECVLVAHDWGGAVAWAFGRLYPDMVSRLIVMNAPPAPVFQKIIQNNREQFKMSWYIFFFQLPWLPELYMRLRDYVFFDGVFGTADPTKNVKFSNPFKSPMSAEDIESYKYTFSQPGARTPPLNWYRAALQVTDQRVQYDMDYVMPVLLLWGEQDLALSLTIPELVAKKYPHITVKRIPNAGHFVQMDVPEVVNKEMRDWLGSLE